MYKTILILFSLSIFISCSKEEGEGGTSSIMGKVHVTEYDKTTLDTVNEYYAPEVNVYLIYGNDKVYSERFRSNWDGSFLFQNLRKGEYRIYAISEVPITEVRAGFDVITINVKIDQNNQLVRAPDIRIKRQY